MVVPSNERRRDLFALAGICGGHFVLGLALLPGWMFSKYPDAARAVRSGALGSENGGDYSPLYLLANMALPPQALRVLQSLLGAAAVVAVWYLARQSFGRAAGWLSACCLALASPLLLYEATIEPDVWVAALNAVGIALLSRAMFAGQVRRRWPAFAFAGAILGLSAATRPSGLLLLGFAAGWCAWGLRREGARGLAGVGALVLAGGLCAAMPAFVLSAAAGPMPVMSPGAVFHMGNRPESTGLGAKPPYLLKLHERQLGRYAAHELYRQFARAAEGEHLTPTQAEIYWVRKVLAYAREHPAAFAGLWLRKLAFFVYGRDAHDVSEVRWAEARLEHWPLLWLPHLGVLGLAGLCAALVRRRPVGLLLAFVGSAGITAAAFYVTSRFRLAGLPALAALAGALAEPVADALKRPRALLAPFLALLAAGAPILGLRFLSEGARMVERGTVASRDRSELDDALADGDFARASECFARIQAAQPFAIWTTSLRGVPFESRRLASESARIAAEQFGTDSATDAYLLAVLAVRAGRCDAALAVARAAADDGFRNSIYDRALDPHLLAAECLRERGDFDGAYAEVVRSLERWPGAIDALAHAIAASHRVATAKMSRTDRERELFELHDPLSAHQALAEAANAWGDPASALVHADAVLTKLPSGLAYYERALALAGLGRDDEAAAAYRDALRFFPARAFPTRPLDSIITDRLAATDPWLALEHLIRAGRIEQARRLVSQLAQQRRITPDLSGQLELLRRAVPPDHWLDSEWVAGPSNP